MLKNGHESLHSNMMKKILRPATIQFLHEKVKIARIDLVFDNH